ncbi:MAG: DUF4258 domain-containing protein [Anaerolineae bacterium]|jgi:hypothetical protein|nr:DUF4258 domain-containing protein [Anaerolineae bacterium]
MRALTTDYTLTEHARRRMSQRNVSLADVLFVLQHGQVEYRAGVALYFMGKRRIPAGAAHAERLEGIAVMCKGSCVITVYRNRKRALKDHRRKTKYNRCEYRFETG